MESYIYIPSSTFVSLFVVILGTVIALGGLHMIAPDHWVPLMIVSRKLNYSQYRTYLNAAALGGLHAITSEAIAGIALVIGLVLVRNFLNYLEWASILLLLAVGIYFIVNGYAEKSSEDGYASSSVKSIIAISAFPDFALIPVMLAGSPLPILDIAAMLVVFILISAVSLTIMVMAAAKGFSKALEQLPPRYIDYIMGLVLFLTSAILAFTSF